LFMGNVWKTGEKRLVWKIDFETSTSTPNSDIELAARTTTVHLRPVSTFAFDVFPNNTPCWRPAIQLSGRIILTPKLLRNLSPNRFYFLISFNARLPARFGQASLICHSRNPNVHFVFAVGRSLNFLKNVCKFRGQVPEAPRFESRFCSAAIGRRTVSCRVRLSA